MHGPRGIAVGQPLSDRRVILFAMVIFNFLDILLAIRQHMLGVLAGKANRSEKTGRFERYDPVSETEKKSLATVVSWSSFLKGLPYFEMKLPCRCKKRLVE